jgi:hypothetical protein
MNSAQAASSSWSSECSGSGGRFSSKRKTAVLNGYLNNNNNNNNNGGKNCQVIELQDETEKMEFRMMTRNRVREINSGRRKQIVGRRMISPGIFQILVQFES